MTVMGCTAVFVTFPNVKDTVICVSVVFSAPDGANEIPVSSTATDAPSENAAVTTRPDGSNVSPTMYSVFFGGVVMEMDVREEEPPDGMDRIRAGKVLATIASVVPSFSRIASAMPSNKSASAI